MKKTGKYCYKCENFIQYYEPALFNYYPSGYGYCNKKNEIIDEKSCCVNFCFVKNINVTAEEIDNVIKDVKQISKILKSYNIF